MTVNRLYRLERWGLWSYDPEHGFANCPVLPHPIWAPQHMILARHPGVCCLCKGQLQGRMIEYSPGKGYFNKHLRCAAERSGWLDFGFTADEVLEMWRIIGRFRAVGSNNAGLALARRYCDGE